MKTNAEHQSDFKAKQKARNLVRLGIDWVTPSQKTLIKKYLSGNAVIVERSE